MHDPTDRTTNSLSSSTMLSSPNRLLNTHAPKLSRPSHQQNLAKKMKVSHVNGVRPTSHEGSSAVRNGCKDQIGQEHTRTTLTSTPILTP
ncbi:unnamed protein product [Rotaria sp. Silwood2]|nr:unnamed protein product [Rotaria sp. Silwood2]CAF4404328.1 unnamed protein product [Rotaria sp. Silwood2]